MRKIEIHHYSKAWPENFEREKALIDTVIGHLPYEIHHIGSTSVVGLAAKPIIDMLLEVDNLEALDKLTVEFQAVGYLAKGEFGIPGRRYFEKGGDQRSHHLHAFLSGTDNVVRHLAFRDYLRHHDEVVLEYANVKRSVAKGCENIIQYCEGKHNFVQFHEKKALAWYADRNASDTEANVETSSSL